MFVIGRAARMAKLGKSGGLSNQNPVQPKGFAGVLSCDEASSAASWPVRDKD